MTAERRGPPDESQGRPLTTDELRALVAQIREDEEREEQRLAEEKAREEAALQALLSEGDDDD
jgi:hypothetical protein